MSEPGVEWECHCGYRGNYRCVESCRDCYNAYQRHWRSEWRKQKRPDVPGGMRKPELTPSHIAEERARGMRDPISHLTGEFWLTWTFDPADRHDQPWQVDVVHEPPPPDVFIEHCTLDRVRREWLACSKATGEKTIFGRLQQRDNGDGIMAESPGTQHAVGGRR